VEVIRPEEARRLCLDNPRTSRGTLEMEGATMDGNYTALTFDELATARSAIRVIRYLTMLTLAVALPIVVVLATPLLGWALLAAIVLSPIVLAYVFFVAARQAKAERHQAQA
jgi:VIT1/CCC1 family predicted Fe2+/Mn2+ transporter